jgi:hypothetical protein
MNSLTSAVAHRWHAVSTNVAKLAPKPAVVFYNWLDARLDRVVAPTVGSRAADWVLASTLIVGGPLLVATLLLAALCGGGLWDCEPAWHDETWYFNEIAVFESQGWQGGYTISHEMPARAPWNHFGTHGPFGPLVYGTFARFTGMHLATIPILNAILLVLGSVFWVACCRVDVRRSWMAALVAITFWPLILYIPTSMQEGLHFSIAFVLAALSVLLIRNRDNRWLLALTLAAVAAAAQIRVTWALAAVPALWIALRPQNRWQIGLFAASSLSFVGVLFLEAVVLVSPYPNFMKTVLDGAANAPFKTCGLIFLHTLKGIEHYLAPNHDTLIEIAFRFQTIMLVAVAIYQLREHYRHRTPQRVSVANDGSQASLESTAYAFALWSVVCIVGFVLVFYDVRNWRDYRVIAPHVLLALLVMVSFGAVHWLKRHMVLTMAVSVFVVLQFAEFHRPRVAFDASQVATFAEEVGKVMPYERGASPWDNTLLVDMHSMNAPELLTLPGGIGISTVIKWDQQAWPPRSKYLLLDRERAAKVGIPTSMQKVAETRIGDIYMRR